MSVEWPKMSTAMIAFVWGDKLASTDATSKQNVSSSISAKTGIACQCTMADALADQGKHRDALEYLAEGRAALPAGVVRALARAQIDGGTLVREANALYDSTAPEERR